MSGPESRKKLTTQYKFCLMDADAKRLGEGGTGRFNADNRGRGCQKLAKSYGRLLVLRMALYQYARIKSKKNPKSKTIGINYSYNYSYSYSLYL